MKKGKASLRIGLLLTALFVLWTVLVCTVDVGVAGESGTAVGFSALNCRFHGLTGVHMNLYTLTDWLGLVPVGICLAFAAMGAAQLLRCRVEGDILLLGVYYAAVMAGYLFFEAVPVNYRPILINGAAEASYPSSTTLLVVSVMPTLAFQMNRRAKSRLLRRTVSLLCAGFSLFTMVGRLLSGIHWLTDIVGGILLGGGLFYLYRASVLLLVPNKTEGGEL